jgi:hypothetical protein
VRALRSPNYRLFFAGQSLSLIGTWMTRIATSWLVYRLTHSALINTILQTIVADDKRGRVMSFYTPAVLGITPIGSLLAGTFASKFGAPATLAGGGVCCLTGATWFARKLPALRALIRPIYRRLGILPGVAAGLQSATALEVPPER